MRGVPGGLGLFTKAGLPGSAGSMPKPDFLWEAALAHRSAAQAWEALERREAAAAAAALVKLPGKAPPLALGPPAPPPPKALQDAQGPPEPLAPGAVCKANPKASLKARLLVPKAPVQAHAMPAAAAVVAQAEKPKKVGRKSSHVRKRPPEEYSYDTSQYYTSSESNEPAEPAAGAAAEGGLEPGPGVGPAAEFSAKPKPKGAGESQRRDMVPLQEQGWGRRFVADGRGFRDVRISTLRERQPKKPRVRRTRKRRSSPHRRRKKTHPKGGRAPKQQEEQQRKRPASRGRSLPAGPRAQAREARPGHGRERSPSIFVPRSGLRLRRLPAQRVHRGRSQGSIPERGDAGGPAAGRAYEDYVVHRGNKKGDGITLRRTMDLQDVDEEYCVHFGRTISGREVAAGWLELAAGGYIPMDVGGTRLVTPARVRSPFRGKGQVGEAPSAGHAAEQESLAVVRAELERQIYDDYIVYRGNKNGTGIGLRRSMDMRDLHPEHCIFWGMEVRGREVAGGWLELASGGYIPMDLEGTRHVVPVSDRREADWSPGRGSARHSRARSSGLATKPGSRQQAGGQQRRQGPEAAGRRAEPEEGGEARRAGPEEGEDTRPYKLLWTLFCKYDDAYFREAMPERLGPGWQELSPRQLKRQVCKWRKSQYRWRFPVEGGFRDYVLRRMPEYVWEKLPGGQQEGYWQSFHYGGQKPEEAVDSSPERQPRSGGPGILRSRPRSRPKSVHRRIAGLSPSEEL